MNKNQVKNNESEDKISGDQIDKLSSDENYKFTEKKNNIPQIEYYEHKNEKCEKSIEHNIDENNIILETNINNSGSESKIEMKDSSKNKH